MPDLIRIDVKLHKRLKIKAAEMETSITALAEKAILTYLDELEKNVRTNNGQQTRLT